MNKIIFITIFSLFYLSASYYVFIRGFQAMPNLSGLKIAYAIIFWLLSISFIVSRMTGNGSFFVVHEITTWFGVFWMAASLYFFLIIMAADFVRLINHFYQFLPSSSSPNYMMIKQITLLISIVAVSSLLFYGYINAKSPKLVKMELKVDKNGGKYQKLRIAMASDIHLGTIIHNGSLTKLTKTINQENPDIILLPGDLIDESLGPILKFDIGAPLRNLKAPLGVWAVPGNHEHIGDFDVSTNYLKSLNIHLLVDEFALVDSSFYVVGRDDKDVDKFSKKRRKPLKSVIADIDPSKPVLLMDHQPYNLQESMSQKVDLQLSGHTHNGQFWPFNLITSRIFELSWGYLKKENTHYYVSSGYGSWGPPIRIGSTPEIVIIDLIFN